MALGFCRTCQRPFRPRRKALVNGDLSCPRCGEQGVLRQEERTPPPPPRTSQQLEVRAPIVPALPPQPEVLAGALREAGLRLSEAPRRDAIHLEEVRLYSHFANGPDASQWAVCGPHALRLLISHPYFAERGWTCSLFVRQDVPRGLSRVAEAAIAKDLEDRGRRKYEPRGFTLVGPVYFENALIGENTYAVAQFQANHLEASTFARWISTVWRLDASFPPPNAPSDNRAD